MLETKANKRKLRELSGLAYRRELGHELAKLEADFWSQSRSSLSQTSRQSKPPKATAAMFEGITPILRWMCVERGQE